MRTYNSYIRIGLFLLTVLVYAGLFGLVADTWGNVVASAGLGLAALSLLELLTWRKLLLKSGLDDGLLWAGVVALGLLYQQPDWEFSGLQEFSFWALLSFLGFIRYADSGMAVACFGCVGWLILHRLHFLAPPAAIAYGVLIYATATAMERFHRYAHCWVALQAFSLIACYAAGNVYVLQELGLLNYAGFYWVFTVAFPVTLLWVGISRVNMLLLWVGTLTLFGLVATLQHHFLVLTYARALALDGLVLIVSSLALIRFLNKPKGSFEDTKPVY